MESTGARGTLKVLVAIVVVLGGAVGGAFALGIVGVPTVAGIENRFGEVTETTTVIHTDLVVSNPNPITLRLGGLTADYEVTMNGISIAHGSKEGVKVGSGNTTIPFSTRMNNSKIPTWWVSHVRNGEHTELRVAADVHSSLLGRSFETTVSRDVNTSVISAFRVEERTPLNASATAVQNPLLFLNHTEAKWGTVTNRTTAVDTTLYLYNPKPYPITVTKVGYDVTMNNLSVGNGTAARTTTIPPGETVPVRATTRIRTQRLDEWWVSHLERNQTTRLRVRFYLVLDLSAANAGTERVELDDLTRTVETDIFGTKDEAGGTGDGTDGDGSTETATTDDGSTGDGGTPTGSETDTPTGTPGDGTPDGTATPTPTPTPGGTPTTDDGII